MAQQQPREEGEAQQQRREEEEAQQQQQEDVDHQKECEEDGEAPQEGQQHHPQEKQHEDQRWEHWYQQGGQGEGGHCQGMEDCLPWSGEKRKGNDKTLLGFGIVNCEIVPKKS